MSRRMTRTSRRRCERACCHFRSFEILYESIILSGANENQPIVFSACTTAISPYAINRLDSSLCEHRGQVEEKSAFKTFLEKCRQKSASLQQQLETATLSRLVEWNQVGVVSASVESQKLEISFCESAEDCMEFRQMQSRAFYILH
jgi:hypothetical protein